MTVPRGIAIAHVLSRERQQWVASCRKEALGRDHRVTEYPIDRFVRALRALAARSGYSQAIGHTPRERVLLCVPLTSQEFKKGARNDRQPLAAHVPDMPLPLDWEALDVQNRQASLINSLAQRVL